MKKWSAYIKLIPVYGIIILVFISLLFSGNRAATVIAENRQISNRKCVVIDAGHGGIDGGATSCTGVLESKINLEIAQRLDDLVHLLGYDTLMVRDTDRSIHTQGNTIAAKKVSDLKERVRIINNTENSVFISIHQNYFSDGRYAGAQVFHSNSDQSKGLAAALQLSLNTTLCEGSKRQIKVAKGVYLMEHTVRPGILVECGFISNSAEESRLRTDKYQMNLCCVLATTLCNFLDHSDMN